MAKRVLLISTLGALLAFPAFPQGDNAPPPGRVARLGYLAGTVSFQPASIDDWVPAELNHPVTNGDHIWTEQDGMAELQTDNAEMRIAGRTNFSFLNLNDNVTQIEITTGSLNVRLHTLGPGEGFEIDTPQLSFTLLRNGDYRVDVNENGDTTVTTVREGDAEIDIGDQATPVHMGTQMTATGAENPNLNPAAVPAPDQFDAFCQLRDSREMTSIAANYISRDITGYEDLGGDFGVWRDVGSYGPVWFPAGLIADWAPYRYGHWAWVEPWGWNWIDDAPWGWTPFHFGRWVNVGGAWGWVPTMPVTVVRPVYAPALVVFTNFDPGVVVADAAVGWVPLAVGEVYVPPFAFGVGVVGLAAFNFGIGIGAGFDVDAAVGVGAGGGYANADAGGTAQSGGDFANGRHMHGDGIHPGHDKMGRGHFGHDPHRAPGRDAVHGNHGDARGHVPPRGVAGRGVQAHRSVPGRPASFEHGAAARNAHPGRPDGRSERAGGGRPNNVRGGNARGNERAGGARGNERGGARAGGARGNERGGPGGRNAGPGGRNAGPGGRNAGPGGRNAGPGGRNAGPGGRNAGPGGRSNAGPGGRSNAGPGGRSNAGPGGRSNAGPGGRSNAGPGGRSNSPAGPGGRNAGPGGRSNSPTAGGRPGSTPGGRSGSPTAGGRPGSTPGGRSQGGMPNGSNGRAGGGRPGGTPGAGGSRPQGGMPNGSNGRAGGGNPGMGGRPGGGNPGMGRTGGNPGMGGRPGGGNPGMGGRPGGGNPGMGGRPGGGGGRPGGAPGGGGRPGGAPSRPAAPHSAPAPPKKK